MLYSFFAVLPPPTKLELSLDGKAREQSIYGREGVYVLGDGLVNGYPNWILNNGSQAMWFSKISSAWFVSDKENLGTDYGGISGPYGNDSYPNEIKHGWSYYDDNWQDAGPNDIIFNVIGTVPNLHLTKLQMLLTQCYLKMIDL